ncbi:hypothetical protein AURDEDRAFT_149590 [Auricularia subglabra TFB-10046 SS5]|nr:hypothetical protein AURDEDRAFT_149590 [Auricularia subglabra TFB-10046 SS5]
MSDAPPPTPKDPATSSSISAQEDDTAALGREIKDHDDCIVVSERSAGPIIYENTAGTRASPAPTLRVPHEVLAQVIVHCATDRNAPVQVLRTLSISLATGADVAEWFTRSGSFKKDITWTSPGPASHAPPHVFSIRSLKVNRAVASVLPQLLAQELPALEALDCPSIFPTQFTCPLISVPNLTRLRLPFTPTPNLLRPIRRQLRCLCLDESFMFELRDMFHIDGGLCGLQALCIEHLTCMGVDCDLPVVIAGQLRTFIANLDGPGMTPFFSSFRMPSLKTLGLGTYGYFPRRDDVAMALESLLIHSGSALRDLRVDGVWIPDTDLLDTLERLPDLQRLAILGGKTSDRFIAGLSSRSVREAWICPKLSALCVRNMPQDAGSGPSRVTRGAVELLVTARRHAAREISSRDSSLSHEGAVHLHAVRLDGDYLVFDSHGDVVDAAWKHYPDENCNCYDVTLPLEESSGFYRLPEATITSSEGQGRHSPTFSPGLQATCMAAPSAEQETDVAATERKIKEDEGLTTPSQSALSSNPDGIAASRAYLASVLRLPFEVLGEIIVYCATDRDAPVQVLRTLSSVYSCTSVELLELFRADGGLSALKAICIGSLNCVDASRGLPVVNASRLRAFFANLSGLAAMPFFYSFRMPSLETAGLGSTTSSARKDAATTLRMLLHHSSAELRDLRLDGSWVSDADLLQLLARVPDLTRLAILNGRTSDRFIAGLSSPSHRASWICPKLATLCVRNPRPSLWDAEQLMVSRAALDELVVARYSASEAGEYGPVEPLRNTRLDEEYTIAHVHAGIVSTNWKRDPDRLNGLRVISTGHFTFNAPTVTSHWWSTDVGAYFFE